MHLAPTNSVPAQSGCPLALLIAITCSPLQAAAEPVGATLDIAPIAVQASSWEQESHGGVGDFPPELTLDGDLAGKSSWRAEGDGAWIQYDLGATMPVTTIHIAFYAAAKRRYTFSVQVSENGEDWATVLDHAKTVEGSLEKEPYAFAPAQARYVRIVGHGNTHKKFGAWINITEVGF